MTEYDFSPAAYQRHFETQARISRWAQSTSSLPQKDPFAPPTPLGPLPSLPKRRESGRRRARSAERDGDRGYQDRDREKSRSRKRSPPLAMPIVRDGPLRAQTTPSPLGFGVYPAPVQSYFSSGPAPGFYAAQPLQEKHRRSRSTSQAPLPPPTHTRSRSYSVVQPMRHASCPPPHPHPHPSQNQNYPPPPPGYVYAQPAPVYAQPPPGYAHAPPQPQPMRSPTREVPLFKRVFGWGAGKGLSRESSSRSRESGRSRDGYREKERERERDGRRERRPRRGDSY